MAVVNINQRISENRWLNNYSAVSGVGCKGCLSTINEIFGIPTERLHTDTLRFKQEEIRYLFIGKHARRVARKCDVEVSVDLGACCMTLRSHVSVATASSYLKLYVAAATIKRIGKSSDFLRCLCLLKPCQIANSMLEAGIAVGWKIEDGFLHLCSNSAVHIIRFLRILQTYVTQICYQVGSVHKDKVLWLGWTEMVRIMKARYPSLSVRSCSEGESLHIHVTMIFKSDNVREVATTVQQFLKQLNNGSYKKYFNCQLSTDSKFFSECRSIGNSAEAAWVSSADGVSMLQEIGSTTGTQLEINKDTEPVQLTWEKTCSSCLQNEYGSVWMARKEHLLPHYRYVIDKLKVRSSGGPESQVTAH